MESKQNSAPSEGNRFVTSIYTHFHNVLLLYAIGICNRNSSSALAQASDLIQDLYLSLQLNYPESRDHFEEKGLPYLYFIIKNANRDYQRKRKSILNYQTLMQQKEEPLIDMLHQSEEARIEELHRMFRPYLTPDELVIIVMYLQGYNGREIGEELKRNINTTNSKLTRIKNKLRNKLGSDRSNFA